MKWNCIYIIYCHCCPKEELDDLIQLRKVENYLSTQKARQIKFENSFIHQNSGSF